MVVVVKRLNVLTTGRGTYSPLSGLWSRTGAGHPRAVGLFHARGKRGKVAWVVAFPMRVFRSAWPG